MNQSNADKLSRVQHTPGPWRVDTTVALGAYGVWTDYATHPGHDGAGYPKQVCSMRPTDVSASREERDANARLIAAAPDLLSACNEAFAFVQRYVEIAARTPSDNCVRLRDRLHAAIAKATEGEAHA